MPHSRTILRLLQRPRLLTNAARIGARRYRRKVHLKSLAPNGNRLGQEELIKDLLEKENDLEWTRRSGAADYNVKRHVLILSALIVESTAPHLTVVSS